MCAGHRLGCLKQVRQAKKAETQAQKKAEKAAKEAAEREKDLRSYKHIMQVRAAHGPDLFMLKEACDDSEKQGEHQSDTCFLQEDAMVSSKEVAEKYKSFQDYEDDFM